MDQKLREIFEQEDNTRRELKKEILKLNNIIENQKKELKQYIRAYEIQTRNWINCKSMLEDAEDYIKRLLHDQD